MREIGVFRSVLRGARGFTLIETILAIALLGIASMGLWAAFYTTVRSSGASEMMVTASFLARQQLEKVIADKKFQNLHYDYIKNANYPNGQLPPPYSAFSRMTGIREVNPDDLITDSNNSGYKRVEVMVLWNDGTQQRSVNLSTLVTNW